MRSLAVVLAVVALLCAGARADDDECERAHSDCFSCRALGCSYDGVSGYCGSRAGDGDDQQRTGLVPRCADVVVAELVSEWNQTLLMTRTSAFFRYTVTEASAFNQLVFTASSTRAVDIRAILLEDAAGWLDDANLALEALTNATLESRWTASTSFFASFASARLEVTEPQPGVVLFEVVSSSASASSVSTVVVAMTDAPPPEDMDVGGRSSASSPLVYGTVAAAFVVVTLVLSLLIIKVRRVEQRFLMAYLEIMGLLPDPDWPATPPLIRLHIENCKSKRVPTTLIDGEPYSGPLAAEYHEGVSVYYALVALPDGVAIAGNAVASDACRAHADAPDDATDAPDDATDETREADH